MTTLNSKAPTILAPGTSDNSLRRSRPEHPIAWVFPIEPIEHRYTAQWAQWWPEALARAGFAVQSMVPPEPSRNPTTREFLDAQETHRYKARQVDLFASWAEVVSSRDIIVFLDAWHPGVVAVRYMLDVAEKTTPIVGVMHAGTWDPWDLLSLRGLGKWARGFEESCFMALDECLISCRFHADLIARAMPRVAAHWQRRPPFVHPLPVKVEATIPETKDRVIVFPHRIAPEKQPDIWDDVVAGVGAQYPGWQWVWPLRDGINGESRPSKATYAQLLARAAIAVSCARQETFGIAMVEAAQAGCFCVVPDRLAYQDTFADWPRYADYSNPTADAGAVALAVCDAIEIVEARGRKPVVMPAMAAQAIKAADVVAAHWWERYAVRGGS